MFEYKCPALDVTVTPSPGTGIRLKNQKLIVERPILV